MGYIYLDRRPCRVSASFSSGRTYSYLWRSNGDTFASAFAAPCELSRNTLPARRDSGCATIKTHNHTKESQLNANERR